MTTKELAVTRAASGTVVLVSRGEGESRMRRLYQKPTEASLGRIEVLTYDAKYFVRTPYISQLSMSVLISERETNG